MKKKLLASVLFCLVALTGNAQKFALIDMEYILENIPAYQRANNELETASQQYQKAIEAKMKEAETLYTAYQKASATLSASQRTQKEEAIIAKEKEAAELRQKYFGPEGEMAKKEEALITPIQNQIYEAVKQIPRGKVATYAQVAAMAGNPKMCRAVGNALHKNPDPDNIPCYRVVNAKGELAGAFAFGGADVQANLLRADGIEVIDNKVDLTKYGL